MRLTQPARDLGVAVLVTLLVPITVLNVLGGLVSGIWLAVLGRWGTIGVGLLMSILMPFVYSILMLPAFGIGQFAIRLEERGQKLPAMLLAFPGAVYGDALITAWVAFLFVNFLYEPDATAAVPTALWVYSIAIAPLAYMGSKEKGDNPGPAVAMFVALLAYLVLLVMWLLKVSGRDQIPVLAAFVVLTSVVKLAVGHGVSRNHQPTGTPSPPSP